MERWSLKSRVVSMTVAVLAVLMLLLILVARHYSNIGLRHVLQEQQDNQVALVATQLDDKFELRIRILQAVAVQLADSIDSNPDRLLALARRSVALPASFDWLQLLAPDGSRIFDTRTPLARYPSAVDRTYFREIMAGAPHTITGPQLSRTTGRPVVTLSVPVLSADGRVVAVLNGGLDLQNRNFLTELASMRPMPTSAFCLVTLDSPSVYVMHPDTSRILAPARGARESCGEDRARRLWTLGPALAPIISHRGLETIHWELVSNLPPEEAYVPFANARPKVAVVCLVALALGALLVYVMVCRLLVPVQQMHRVVLQSAQDPDAYKALATTRSDEVGDLSRAFASLMEQLAIKTEGLHEAGKLALERKQLIEAIADRIPDLVAYLDRDERYVFANRAYEARFGWSVSAMIGRTVREVWGDALYDAYVAPNMALARLGEPVSFDYVWQSPSGPRTFEVMYKPVRDADACVAGIHVYSRDVTDEREELRRLEQTTLVDHLTELLNRKGFDRRFAEAFERAHETRHETRQPIALLLVDLDDFKDVNDTFGHARGDRLLGLVAARLEGCVSALDAVARIGGDEFAVVLERVVAPHAVDTVALRIVRALLEPYEIDGCVVRCSASVGAAIHDPRDSSSPNELFMRADTALYAAKHAGKGQYTLFDHHRARAV
ncbi:diguanylate cyclase domain-containing protein [Pararobbsia silviterrae]|uniref:Diguanylate cyclase n=1 Tax=Pararobbsia silviterrae TaxID=1792498 RepID=A0A494Y7L9_9BURK|nr:diguanylate cyclase [Pararobbsia silviterrae]RKP58691.1 diguanylate cyclase [Pararobbsia silviterrae]